MCVDHDPLLEAQVVGLLDGQTLEGLLVAVDDLVGREHLDLRGSKAEALQLNGHLLNLQSPVLHRSLLCQLIDHLLDLSNLVSRRDSRHGQGITHPSPLSDRVRHSVQQTELTGQ